MATVFTAATSGRQAESLIPIDMSKLTQSELQTLSLSSSNLNHYHLNSDHLFLPAIDRSIFHESVGSRRQTYCRPDSSPSAAGHHHRNRLAGLRPASKPQAADDDPVRRENISILKTLRHYINQNPNSDLFSHNIDLTPLSLPSPVALEKERKRKRRKGPSHAVECGEIENVGILEMKNKNGVEINVDSLSGLVDPYGEELRKRTEGLVTEEELLGFFRKLGGEWCSRRKKRKIVDAGIFGDLLPVGWKLLLGLRRQEGRISVYCRRYVSPAGQHFISCTEISSYMRSYLGMKNASKPLAQSRDGILQELKVDSKNNAGTAEKDDSQSPGIIGSSSGTSHSSSVALVKAVDKFGVENIHDIQIHNLFECHKCNMTFAEKDAYLQHLLSVHQRTTRKYRLGSSVGDGVIMKDGKFECQFCHKVFEERRRYNGHVGIHVRNYVRGREEFPAQGSVRSKLESSSKKDLPSKISKIDFLTQIAQSSILEISTKEEHARLSSFPACEKPNQDTFESPLDATRDDGLKIDSLAKLNDFCMESSIAANKEYEMKLDGGKTPDEELIVNNVTAGAKVELDNYNNPAVREDSKFADGVVLAMDDQNDVSTKNVSDVTTDSMFDNGGASEMDDRNGNACSELGGAACQTFTFDDTAKSGFVEEQVSEISVVPLRVNMASSSPRKKVDTDGGTSESVDRSLKDAQLHDDAIQTFQQDSEQKFYQSSIPDSGPKEEEVNFCTADQREITLEAFGELRYDRIIEPMELDFVTTQASLSGPEEATDLAVDMSASHEPTSACVWCGIVFSHDGTDGRGMQSGSVGFVCPTCKVKISCDFAVLEGGSPANAMHFSGL